MPVNGSRDCNPNPIPNLNRNDNLHLTDLDGGVRPKEYQHKKVSQTVTKVTWSVDLKEDICKKFMVKNAHVYIKYRK